MMFYIQEIDSQSLSLAFSPSLTPVILVQGRIEGNKAKHSLVKLDYVWALVLFSSYSNSTTDTAKHFHLFLEEALFTFQTHQAHCPIATKIGLRKQTGKSFKAKRIQTHCTPIT